MAQLTGKVCIITGGAGSIGLATARLFVQQGAKVLLVDHDAARLAEVIKTFDPAVAMSTAADVSDSEAVKNFINLAIERWGAIDVMFSNAGNSGVIAALENYPEDTFDDVYRVHVKGAFLACKYVLPKMQKGGSIIITSSVAGLRGDAGVYAYITAKHAQIGLMRCVAKEGAPRNIRVNTIHPGPTSNSFQGNIEQQLSTIIGRDAGDFFDENIPLGRHAKPEEIAQSVLYLASDQSSFTTGSTLVVDGGMSA